MARLRYDIIERNGGWLLIDSRGPPRAFLSSAEALTAAKSEVTQQTEPAEIHQWRNQVPTQVYPPRRAFPN